MVSGKISKQDFISVIENLRQQYLQDKEYVDGISTLYSIDMPFYDNKHLLDSTMTMLRVWFPKDENGFCEIEHFCYVCDFGKIGEVKDAEELWGVLVGRVKPDLNNEEICFCDKLKRKCTRCYVKDYKPEIYPELVNLSNGQKDIG